MRKVTHSLLIFEAMYIKCHPKYFENMLK